MPSFDIASLKRYYFKPVLKRLGLEDFSWHDLRHFYATTLVHSPRYSDKQVQEWMGHASYAFTLDRYGHAPEEEIVSMPFDDIYARSNVTPMERRAV
ncbi:tyrosine-type recombinase/integrase [Microbacterium sp. PAMC22086]|nr:tyrosine-type recombinase/integrase [Microbacterium sp. PAMC22086]